MKCTLSSLKFSAALLALALAACPALFAQTYEIRLSRPDPIGSSYHFSAVAKESSSEFLKQGDKVLKDENTKYSVEAELAVTVLAENEKGKCTRIKFEVERLTRVEGDARKELLPKGSVVTAFWDGKEQGFQMGGGALEPDTEESLKLLDLITDDPESPSDDEVFGTKERKKVGDTWQGNAELISKEMGRLGLPMKKEDVKSALAFEKTLKLGATDCMQLHCAMTCDKFMPPIPADFTVDQSAFKFNFTSTFPIAVTGVLPWEGSTEMTMTLTATGKPDPNAPEFVFRIANERTLTGHATELK